MVFSYHVHSLWSDGEGEIADIIRKGREIGLDEIGISDHYVITPDRRQLDWSMPIDGLDDYVDAVQSAAGEAGEDMIVRLGIEADFFPETVEELREVLASQPFDYVIGSVHIVDGFPIDCDASHWEKLSPAERDDVIKLYWVRVRQMAESGVFDFVGHVDLTKKFAYYPVIDVSGEITSALDAIARADMAVELNTAGWFMPCAEGYPSPAILQGCFARDIPMLVSADSHTPGNLIRAYERGYRILRDTGYTEIVSYAGRQMFANDIPSLEI